MNVAGTGGIDAEAGRQRQLANDHLLAALKALLTLIEAHPRLAALMATRPAQAPLLSCLGPVCRCAAENTTILSRIATFELVYWSPAVCMPCRRMHKLADAEGLVGMEALKFDGEVAALALAVLVRLTTHSGTLILTCIFPYSISLLRICRAHLDSCKRISMKASLAYISLTLVELIPGYHLLQGVWMPWQTSVP